MLSEPSPEILPSLRRGTHLPDPKAAKDDLVRIVDESGEDYLYHRNHFVFVDFPAAVKKKLRALESAVS